MHDWFNILQGASFVGLLIVSAYSGIQAARVKGLNETIIGLRGDRDDLEKRLDLRDDELREERALRARERADDQAKIAELSSAVDVLRQTVTGEAHLVTIEDLVTHMNRSLVEHHETAIAGLGQLTAAIERLGRGEAS